ncbi:MULTISPECIES: HlyD family secretion protein [Thalassospira]|uniref:HlyD family secretion protein n=1 Tax=Thalassospira TaxID=168934 RepID=UPI001FFFA452|nr:MULTISPECIES: biotin/lipoyl-binding protein [Thalassospira]MCK2167281.1 biotin/lipoyl-binding protein [Thalassospira xiamenensis]WOI11400.1 biotin/lipoyl-binding protein [Thalassospira lucentensis]
MFELMLCSIFTVLPDYLIRRYAQGKRIGKEITLFSVWYELRYGIVGCAILTISLITLIFYYHPSSHNVASFYRTLTILPEKNGRVVEIYVDNDDQVKSGDPLFRLDDRTETEAAEIARQQVQEIRAQMAVTQADLAVANGNLEEAQGAYEQVREELAVKADLLSRGTNAVSRREVERLEVALTTRQGAVNAAKANVNAVETKMETLLPAQLASAEASLRSAEVALGKTVVRAGVDGEIQQFALQIGDVVNPLLRPAGILIPAEPEEVVFQAGFQQVSAQVVKAGILAEMSCASLPFEVIPMLVTSVQPVIAAGQFRPTDRLLDISERAVPGTFLAKMIPLYPEQIKDVPRGSQCVANAYTNTHAQLENPEIGTGEWLFLHMVQTVGIVHALLLRIQALLWPVQTLVLSAH